MNATKSMERGKLWLEGLAEHAAKTVMETPSVLEATVPLGDQGEVILALAVVADPASGFPRALHGEFGLEQAWAVAARIRQYVEEDATRSTRRPILAIVDTPGQAFGRVEEQQCISVACAAAVDAYIAARRAGHPLLTLIVGRAISGSFLAHGLQADRILAIEDDGVMMHAMSPQSIARITRRTLAEVTEQAASSMPMSYSIENAHRLGVVHTLIPGISAEAPTAANTSIVKEALSRALCEVREEAKNGVRDVDGVKDNPNRVATATVERLMREQWNLDDLA
ncbi:biotin-independent malonate decarboxylase subunit gamma [Granulicella arctica]|uniref:Biotin-independent malonate decarboxylase gamma subunit n=1 Tax=Granulicella arctica TaxID=940613 RepID=A0A7Y9PGQ8_9BACT|nr:biotin-independent malonate decarboxylase subunit gamma [Granulicella arctica]NYF79561.1 biotin-independent malonate decarboxylase gamma subunit [Granulicella arctica]